MRCLPKRSLIPRLDNTPAHTSGSCSIEEGSVFRQFRTTGMCRGVRPSLPDLLTYLMDQHGMSRADLVPLLGTPSRVSEVLTGKRELSMSMVRKLRERFHISADLLISPVRRRGLAA
jgi:hypothetical protein